MATTVTLAQLRDRLEKMTNIEGDTHFTATEKNDIIRSAAAETWDRMVAAGLGDRFAKRTTFNTVGGTLGYDLTSSGVVTDQDFYRIQQLYVDEGGGHLRPLERLNPAEIQSYRPVPSVVSMVLYYIPTSPSFKDTMGAYDDTKTLEGVNGWEEHTLCTAAITVKKKKEDDYRPFLERKLELEDRIAFMGSRDASQPARVTRRRRSTRAGYWYPYHGVVNAYGLRGNNIELYYSYPWVP